MPYILLRAKKLRMFKTTEKKTNVLEVVRGVVSELEQQKDEKTLTMDRLRRLASIKAMPLEPRKRAYKPMKRWSLGPIGLIAIHGGAT